MEVEVENKPPVGEVMDEIQQPGEPEGAELASFLAGKLEKAGLLGEDSPRVGIEVEEQLDLEGDRNRSDKGMAESLAMAADMGLQLCCRLQAVGKSWTKQTLREQEYTVAVLVSGIEVWHIHRLEAAKA